MAVLALANGDRTSSKVMGFARAQPSYGLLNNPTLGQISKNNLVNWAGVAGADVGIDVFTNSTAAQGAAIGDTSGVGSIAGASASMQGSIK